MQCPFCQNPEIRVLESRTAEAGRSIRRRRECVKCGRRFTTYERIEFVPITVIKRDGQREPFDRSKLLRGIVTACGKTGLTTIRLEALVEDLEAQLQQRVVREVTSTEIGEAVLRALQPLSDVAYVRFASVYRQFQSVGDFVEELNRLKTVGVTQALPVQTDTDIDTGIAKETETDQIDTPESNARKITSGKTTFPTAGIEENPPILVNL